MSKIKSSMKITNHFKKVWRCGYCDLSNVFRYFDPVYYNCGVYGWNCDLYIDYEHDQIITTGYRNMRGARIPSELIHKYEEIAKDIIKNMSWGDFEKLTAALSENRKNFFNELNGGKKA